MPTAEQRTAPRFSVSAQAALRDRATQRLLPVRLLDLSATGAGICCSDVIVDDADYEIEFNIPGAQTICAHCRIARVSLSADQSDFCAGIMFDGDLSARTPELDRVLRQLSRENALH